jgi:hypothetical protein
MSRISVTAEWVLLSGARRDRSPEGQTEGYPCFTNHIKLVNIPSALLGVSCSGFKGGPPNGVVPSAPANVSTVSDRRFRGRKLGIFRRSFLRIEGELALPLIMICNNLRAGSSLL